MIPVTIYKRVGNQSLARTKGLFEIYAMIGRVPELINIGGTLYFKYIIGGDNG